MLNVILLAAGQGLRMGGPNKLLLPFRGRTVFETTLEQLCAADIGDVFVVSGHQRNELLPLLTGFAVQEIFNPDYARGMTSSIRAGVRSAVNERPYMICLADMPMISTASYKLLATSFLNIYSHDPSAILLPRFGQSRGNPVLFADSYREAILQHSDPEGCRGIVQANEQHLHWVQMPDDGILRDLDTPNDYAKLESPL